MVGPMEVPGFSETEKTAGRNARRCVRTLIAGAVVASLTVGAGVDDLDAAALLEMRGEASPIALQVASLSDEDNDEELRSGRYSLLVRKIQLRLAEIGVYRGPIGGVMSPETIEAIRRYQQTAGLPVDGKPSRELLEHLTSAAGAAQHLLQRLDEARRVQIEEARLALEREFGPDWANPDVDTARSVDRTGAACFELPTTRCLIHEARQAATQVDKEDLRDWALSNVVEAQARAGRPDEALEVARTIQDPRSVVAAISSIAVSLAKAGRTEDALVTADRVPSERLKDKALRAIAEGQAAGGSPDQAEETARRIARDQERVPALAAIARAYLEAGDERTARVVVEEARTLVGTIRTKVFRDWATGEVAVLLALADQIAEGKALASTIETPMHRIQALCEIVIIEAESDELDDARETLAGAKSVLPTIPRKAARQQALARVAIAEAAVGDFAAARSSVRKIDQGYTLSFVQTKVAVNLARFGEIDDAVALATSVEDDRLKVDTLLSIARILDDDGEDEKARETEAEGHEIARAIKSTLDRAFVLSDLAVVNAQAGRADFARETLAEALDVARKIDDPWARSRSLSKVASALAVIGEI